MSDLKAKRKLQASDLQWLACPLCRATLVLKSQSVVCTGCRRQFPIEDELYILLAERAF